MSRTYKDKPWKHTAEKKERDISCTFIGYPIYCTVYYPGTKTKKKRSHQGWWDGYYSKAPSWWVKEFMTVPKRAACRNWEKTRTLDNLEDDYPDFGNKPFIYYW